MPYNVISEATAQPAPSTTLGEPRTSQGETLATLREALRLDLLGRQDVASSRLDLWVNQAYGDLASSLQLEEHRGSLALVMVPSQFAYVLPAVVETLMSVAIQDYPNDNQRPGYPLDKIDLAHYRELREPAWGPQDPRSYFRQDQILVVFPTPTRASTLSLDVRFQPLPLVEDSDSPVLPLSWHEAIGLLARAKALQALHEHGEAVLAMNDYTDWVRRRGDRRAQEDENRFVQSSLPARRSELRNIGRRPWRS